MGMGMSYKLGAGAGALDGAGPLAATVRRNDPWSARNKAAFLESLAATGSVTRSALLVGRTAAAAQGLKGRDAAFAADFRAAMQAACETLEAALIEHAMGDFGGDCGGDQGIAGWGAIAGGDERVCPTCGHGGGQSGGRPFDPALALKVLGQRAAFDAKPSRAPLANFRQVPIAEVEASLNRKIDAIIRARKST